MRTSGSINSSRPNASRGLPAKLTWKQRAIDWLPKRLRLPTRFLYHRIRGTLEQELFLLPGLIADGHTAVDIGANWGCYTYYLSKFCRRVEAFEPIQSCAEIIETFGRRNIRVHRVALSSAGGWRELHIPLRDGIPASGYATFNEPTAPAQALAVPVRTLDEYEFTDVALLKIDVEGHELEVLKGASRTIERERPVILIEVEQRHIGVPMADVFRQITQYGYRGFFWTDGGLRPLDEFAAERHQVVPDTESAIDRRDYVNNFIFTTNPVRVQSR
jgi:FkbM family methyltransferase